MHYAESYGDGNHVRRGNAHYSHTLLEAKNSRCYGLRRATFVAELLSTNGKPASERGAKGEGSYLPPLPDARRLFRARASISFMFSRGLPCFRRTL